MLFFEVLFSGFRAAGLYRDVIYYPSTITIVASNLTDHAEIHGGANYTSE
jgi:hypothetical protein